jgi:hypothetical protein
MQDSRMDGETCRRLLEFYRQYQEKHFAFFLKLRQRWRQDNPGRKYPGLCADIAMCNGEFKPACEQRAWSWGDGRALGLWSSLLNMDKIPDKEASLDPGRAIKINFKEEYVRYCEDINLALTDRLQKNNGLLPFVVDIETNKSSADSRNLDYAPDEKSYGHLFAVNGFFQFGMYENSADKVELAMRICRESVDAIENSRFAVEPVRLPKNLYSHGPRMILAGAIGDILKTIHYLEEQGNGKWSNLTSELVDTALSLITPILDNHYSENPSSFWEFNNQDHTKHTDDKGRVILDVGHATELAGFIAELIPFLSETGDNGKWSRQAILSAALNIHLFADELGWSAAGVMVREVDILSRIIVKDCYYRGEWLTTAQWWIVREHCATALKLFTLTGDKRCMESYYKAQRASYSHFPKEHLDGMMIRTINADTLEWLDIEPAMGAYDPMHDQRSRLRETENLELIAEKEL